MGLLAASNCSGPSSRLVGQVRRALQTRPPVAKEAQLEFVFSGTVESLIADFSRSRAGVADARRAFYRRHFAEVARAQRLPLEYFHNPFRLAPRDARVRPYSSKMLRGSQRYFAHVFSSASFREAFRQYSAQRFLSEYLLETPCKLHSILCDAFYFHGRSEKQSFSWSFPWELGEVQRALDLADQIFLGASKVFD